MSSDSIRHTVESLLREGKKLLESCSATPYLDAQVLLEYCTGLTRVQVISEPHVTIESAAVDRYRALLGRRALGEPVAYVVGTREFYGRNFAVAPAVLVPRPETELLVELVLSSVEDARDRAIDILDLGTGSGCIGITLALELQHMNRNFRITATDISATALEMAVQNARTLGATVDFKRSDWFSDLNPQSLFDIIVSNPPYIADNDTRLSPETRYEPRSALIAGSTGLEAISILIEEAAAHLKPAGSLIIETGSDQHDSIRALAVQSLHWSTIETFHDAAGHERVIRLSRA